MLASEPFVKEFSHVLIAGTIRPQCEHADRDRGPGREGAGHAVHRRADLSCSYGLPHQATHPTVRAGIKRIFDRATRGGMKVGVPAYDAKQALEVAELGTGYITSPAVDTYHLTQTLKAHLQSVKAAFKR
jgi:hypothetical protein